MAPYRLVSEPDAASACAHRAPHLYNGGVNRKEMKARARWRHNSCAELMRPEARMSPCRHRRRRALRRAVQLSDTRFIENSRREIDARRRRACHGGAGVRVSDAARS